jgi:hypothetical protein
MRNLNLKLDEKTKSQQMKYHQVRMVRVNKKIFRALQ